MFGGNPTHFTSSMQFTKSEKAFTTEKGLLKGYDQKNTLSTKGKRFSTNHKKGFVRLDSFEDYEVIDLDMVKDKSHINKSNSDYSINQSQEENLGQMNSFNNRMYHPAAFVPPPYTYSNRHAGMSFKNQQQIQRPSNLACQSSKLANQFSSWQSPCQITNSQSYYPYHTGCPDPSRLRSSTTQNLSTQVPFCDSDDRITHHVPYNLTKGQYEYWMSVPGVGRNNPNCEAMQAYCHNQPLSLGCTTKHIPAQISRTVSSWVGGIYDWVASSVDLALKPNVPPSQNTAFHTTKPSDTSGLVQPLNPNAKVFTPHATLNPNAKEFLPSTMVSTTETSITKSSSVPTSIGIFQPAIVGAINMVKLSRSSQDREVPQTSPQISSEEADLTNVLDESDSDLSQMVIEQLIQEANKEHKMEKLNCVEKSNEVSDSCTPTPSIMERESDHLQLKSVAARKTTPWINLRQRIRSKGLVKAMTKSTPTSLHEATDDRCDLTLPEDDDIETDDGSDQDDFEESFSPKNGIGDMNHIRKQSLRKQSASSSCDDFEVEYDSSRVRSLSTCSDESNFIEFGSPSTPEHSAKVNGEKPKRCLLQAFVVRAKSFLPNIDPNKEKDTETDEEESDSDDDQDWDEIDGDDDVADDDLWQSFKARVLVCPMASKGSPKESNSNLFNEGKNCPSVPSNIGINVFFLQNGSDPKPENENGCHPTKKTTEVRDWYREMEISDANNKWDRFYNNSSPVKKADCIKSELETKASEGGRQGIASNDCNSRRNVTIAPVDSFIIIREDPNLSVDLQTYRNGPYSCGNTARREADKERMEKLLSPIFQHNHRQRVLEKLQRGEYCRPENI